MRLNAKPHINGNDADDFLKAAAKLYDAVRAVETALREVDSNVTHGRNYQHVGQDEAFSQREEDLQIVADIRRLGNTTEALAKAIMEARK